MWRGCSYYAERLDEFVELYAYARSLRINIPVISTKPFWVLPGIVALSDADWSRHPDSLLHPELLSSWLDEISVWSLPHHISENWHIVGYAA